MPTFQDLKSLSQWRTIQMNKIFLAWCADRLMVRCLELEVGETPSNSSIAFYSHLPTNTHGIVTNLSSSAWGWIVVDLSWGITIIIKQRN